ncbi:hypothetical protein GH714_038289 [Hevea brasiliensis]|uniref:1-(5-phosphoribosyl)-5-[(5-phosphoribosylamino)methylideneamino]imidazole-4-carboxamideisomerase n=1 Tax=Hevea brasiliensis TaxID=3981 RepID=A0A6A6L532_HEVBR|nr:hypothetical protein GH714_038289 [Hevea brasiliensis]
MRIGGLHATSSRGPTSVERNFCSIIIPSVRNNYKCITTSPSLVCRSSRLSIHCAVRFRPCIDLHKGKVKQIVGSTLRDSKEDGSILVTNFESDKSAAEFANLYKEDGLVGGHVIMLGADPLSKAAAVEALHAYPGGLQVGGGINTNNCLSYIEEGASHVIVTSYVFNNGQMDLERLRDLVHVVGKQRLVLDLSCRKKEGRYAIVTDRWQKFSDVYLDEEVLEFLANYADEFLVHGVDVEGKKLGIDEELVELLGRHSPYFLKKMPCNFGNIMISPILVDLTNETAKYVFPKRFESRNLEEALMAVPDLETVEYKVLSRRDQYEIREVEPYFIAETTMPGKTGFDFSGASQSFNVLAEYLFGKNTTKEKMEMSTPVFTRKAQSVGERMEMTTPVITKKMEDQDKWQMSFVMPSKYGANLPLPKDPTVKIKEVPRKVVAVAVFSGFVTDEDVKQRELKLRNALKNDMQFRVKEGASPEVAQFNPPFTLPFTRRNEIALEVKRKEE